MEPDTLMTEEEIHVFGIEIVFGQLQKEGYEIVDVNTKIGVVALLRVQIRALSFNFMVLHISGRWSCYGKLGFIPWKLFALPP